MPVLCRDCFASLPQDRAPARCPACGGPRLLAHPELARLGIAHLDCDAFYAAVETRENPALAGHPLIVGGGTRGVVTTCCYIARISGVRSAMPMFQALKLCPDAVVVRPRMALYAEASRAIRALMEDLTPLVEPLSLDEAFLDLRGTERLHGRSPAETLARLARRVQTEVGVSVSIGLSHNKFLAKIASDLDKPRGFSVIGQAETEEFLAGKPISLLWGVGEATRRALAEAGLRSIDDLRRAGEAALAARFGAGGARLARLARGQDDRPVRPERAVRSISNETTFSADLAAPAALGAHLWEMCMKVSDRAKAKGLAGRTVTLKLKRHTFRSLTRQTPLHEPTQLADRIHAAAAPLLAASLAEAPFRLIGVGLSDLGPAGPDPVGDLFDPSAAARARAERVTDAIRARFGPAAILRGRARPPGS